MIPYSFSRSQGVAEVQRQSIQKYPTIAEELRVLTGIDCGYTRAGRIHVFTSDGQRDNAHKDVECSDGWQKMLPAFHKFDGEPEVVIGEFGGLQCDLTAFVKITLLIEALKKACQLAGVEVCEQTPITDLVEICAQAEQVVVATGCWTQALIPDCEVRPVKGQALKLKLPKQIFTRMVRQNEVYLVPYADGTVLVGSTSEPEAGFDITPTAEARNVLFGKACQMVPALAQAEVVDHWAGLRPRGGKRQPLIKRIDGQTLMAAGHHKIGLCLAPSVADAVVQDISSIF